MCLQPLFSVIKKPRRNTGAAAVYYFSFFLTTWAVILKSVSEQDSFKRTLNDKNHAETLQVYLVVEDNVLISTRRED